MKVIYNPTPKISVEVEVKNSKEMFEKLGPMQEVLENDSCGKCKGKTLRFVHRTDDKNRNYYELQCQTKNDKGFVCGAKLAFGQSIDGEKLFPRRYEQNKETNEKTWLPDNGWMKWDKKAGKNV